MHLYLQNVSLLNVSHVSWCDSWSLLILKTEFISDSESRHDPGYATTHTAPRSVSRLESGSGCIYLSEPINHKEY